MQKSFLHPVCVKKLGESVMVEGGGGGGGFFLSHFTF